jgi:hypothetical protein
MPILREVQTASWEKDQYEKVTFWYPINPGTGTVLVQQGETGQRAEVPGSVNLNKSQNGSLTNYTGTIIEYTLS